MPAWQVQGMNFSVKFGVNILHNVFNIVHICKYLYLCALFLFFGQEASKNASANLVWFQWELPTKLKS